MKFCGILPVHMISPDTTGDTSTLKSHMPNLCVCFLGAFWQSFQRYIIYLY